MRPHLSQNQRSKCLKVMNEIEKFKSFSFYNRPVDPERDQCPDYFDVVEQPMDLGTVRYKLEHDEYASVTDWKSDMSLIWKNCIKYNRADSLFGLTAQQLCDTFRSLSKSITDDEVADWTTELTQLDARVKDLLATLPKPLPQPYSNDEEKSRPRAKTESEAPVKATKRDTKPVREAPAKKAATSKKGTAPVKREEEVPPPEPVISLDEAVKITEDVGRLEDDEDISQVIDLIRTYEPTLEIGDEVDLEIEQLSPRTLVALRQLLQRLLNK